MGSSPPTALPTDNYMSIGVVVLAVQSRGNVTINSSDTAVDPVVNPNWFLDPADLEVAVQGFRRAREIASLRGIVIKEYSPGADVQSDAEIQQWIKENASLTYHASVTCKHSRASHITTLAPDLDPVPDVARSRCDGQESKGRCSRRFQGKGLWSKQVACCGRECLSIPSPRTSAKYSL